MIDVFESGDDSENDTRTATLWKQRLRESVMVCGELVIDKRRNTDYISVSILL